MEIQPFPDDRTIEAVVIDLDGTLLNSEHTVSDRNKEAIKKVIGAGIKVIFATGKTRKSAEGIIDELNLATYGVYNQGTMIYDSAGNVREQTVLDPKATRRAVQYAENEGYDVIAYAGNRLIAKRVTDRMDFLEEYGEPAPQSVGPLVNRLLDTQIHKLIIVGGDQKRLNALRWQLDQQIGTLASFTTTAVEALEVLPKGASKGQGVRSLLKTLGIDPLNVVAIGDAENDVDMLKLVGYGIAMENASDTLKEVADAVVSSNDDDGVADALETYILKLETSESDDSNNDETDSDAAGNSNDETADDAETSDDKTPAGESSEADT